MHRCTYGCGRLLPARMFYRNKRRPAGSIHAGCKDCRRKAARDYSKRTYVPRGKAA